MPRFGEITYPHTVTLRAASPPPEGGQSPLAGLPPYDDIAPVVLRGELQFGDPQLITVADQTKSRMAGFIRLVSNPLLAEPDPMALPRVTRANDAADVVTAFGVDLGRWRATGPMIPEIDPSGRLVEYHLPVETIV
jgi:hypothetical protein